MVFVAFETSTEWCSVALFADGEISSVELRAGHRHSELALPMMDQLLSARRLKPRELDAVAFGAGPGAFTGLRIACGLAQGLAVARNLPVIGISSLEAIAQESGGERVVACIDARMREVYYSALQRQASRWREVVATQCVAPKAMELPPGDGWIGCGSGFAAYTEMSGHRGLKKVLPEVHPTAMAVALLAAPRLQAGEGVDAAEATPLYVRNKVAFTTQELASR